LKSFQRELYKNAAQFACNFVQKSKTGSHKMCLHPALCVAAILVGGCLHRPDARADFLKLVDRPRVSLDPQLETLPGTDGLAQFHFLFVTDADQRVPGMLMLATNFTGRRPVVIALHGTGGSKNSLATLCRKLAERGFIAVAIAGRYPDFRYWRRLLTIFGRRAD
jgi:hypothetical protein